MSSAEVKTSESLALIGGPVPTLVPDTSAASGWGGQHLRFVSPLDDESGSENDVKKPILSVDVGEDASPGGDALAALPRGTSWDASGG
jgi:hypothetical protein